MRGYFEIGIVNGKSPMNLGTLWRSAYQLGAAGIFTIGKRYSRESSDTYQSWRHIPLRCYQDFEEFFRTAPFSAPVIGVEMGGTPLQEFSHPTRAIYLLGAEDHGLPQTTLEFCHQHVSLPSVRVESYNVAVAGALVMYDRLIKQSRELQG